MPASPPPLDRATTGEAPEGGYVSGGTFRDPDWEGFIQPDPDVPNLQMGLERWVARPEGGGGGVGLGRMVDGEGRAAGWQGVLVVGSGARWQQLRQRAPLMVPPAAAAAAAATAAAAAAASPAASPERASPSPSQLRPPHPLAHL